MCVCAVERAIALEIEHLLFTDVLIKQNIGLRVELLRNCHIPPSVGSHRSLDRTLIEEAFIYTIWGIEFPITSVRNATAHTRMLEKCEKKNIPSLLCSIVHSDQKSESYWCSQVLGCTSVSD